MRKKLTCIMAGFFAMALVFMAFNDAEASTQRLNGMGLQQDTYWMIDRDTAYIASNPSHVLEFGSLMAFAPNANAAVMILAPAQDSRIMVSTRDTGGMSPVNLLYGFASGDMKMGASLALGYKDDDADREDYIYLGASFGVTMPLGGDTLDFSVAYQGTPGDQETDLSAFGGTGADLVESAGTGTLTLRARYTMIHSAMHKFHFHGGLQYSDRSFETAEAVGPIPEGAEFDNVNYALSLGAANQMRLSDNALAYAGILTKYWTAFDGDVSFLEHKLAFGTEFQLLDSLKGRLGVNRVFYESSNNGNQPRNLGDTTGTANAQNITSGITYSVGNLILDWQLDLAAVQGGPYFITGNDGGAAGSWSMDFIACYRFDTPVVAY